MPAFRFLLRRAPGLRRACRLTARLSSVLLAALLASAASAQSPDSTPLVPQTGGSLAYRVGLPEGWKIDRQDVNAARKVQAQDGRSAQVTVRGEALTATRGAGYVHLLTNDIVPVKNDAVPGSWAEQRRIVTTTLMGSDSLLFGVLANTARQLGDGFGSMTREMRTLGGQRAAYMGGLHSLRGLESRVEFYLTVSDGVMYVMAFADSASGFAAREPLFARVRDSLVFARAPVSLPEGSAPAPAP